jgi:hypothetical protein
VFKHMILFVVTDKFDLLAMGAVVLMLAWALFLLEKLHTAEPTLSSK